MRFCFHMAKFSVFYTGAHTHTQLAISSLDSTVTCFTHFSPWVNLLLGLQLQRHVVLSKSLSNYYIQTYINFLLKLHQLFSIITCGLDCEKDAWLQMFCNCPQELKKKCYGFPAKMFWRVTRTNFQRETVAQLQLLFADQEWHSQRWYISVAWMYLSDTLQISANTSGKVNPDVHTHTASDSIPNTDLGAHKEIHFS